jgi:hypothetical protein
MNNQYLLKREKPRQLETPKRRKHKMTHLNFNLVKQPTAQESQFEIYQLNCNGLRGKVPELKIYIYTKKPEIVSLCETWLKRNEPKFYGYQSIWLHQLGEKGGMAI